MAVMKKKESKKAVASARDYSILREPVITEKASLLSGTGNAVAFRVRKDATKVDIKNAVERIFDVEVAKVRTCNYIGKLKRTTRSVGRTAGSKKAYVTLKPGHSIDIVEGL